MAIPRLACGKIIRLSAAVAIVLTGCATKEKTPEPAQDSQTTIRMKPGTGEPGAPLDPNSTLEALAHYYESAAESSGRSIEVEPAAPTSSLPKKIRAGTRTTIGKILMVNEGSRFVLIDTKAGLKPPPGATVRTQGMGGTSTLRVSTEERREFLSADIVMGVPSTGDLVIWDR